MTHKFTQLQRALIHITGPDRLSFLQGLITQDVGLLSPSQSLYSLLLTPQGRFLYDFFLIPGNVSNSSLFIEIAPSDAPALFKRLNLYKLRSNVTLKLQENVFCCAYWNAQEPLGNTSFLDGLIFYQDPRLQELGGRLISFSSLEASKNFLIAKGFQETSLEDYKAHLLEWGVPTSPHDMIPEKSIPLECGMEDLQAISWTKGCYLGQELTARTHHQGLVRKRLVPGRLDGAETAPLNARLLFEGQEAGLLRSSEKGVALALLRLEFLESSMSLGKPFQLRHPTEEGQELSETDLPVTFMPFLPPWLKIRVP